MPGSVVVSVRGVTDRAARRDRWVLHYATSEARSTSEPGGRRWCRWGHGGCLWWMRLEGAMRSFKGLGAAAGNKVRTDRLRVHDGHQTEMCFMLSCKNLQFSSAGLAIRWRAI